MNDDLQKRIQAALANPQNMGEMAGADSIGTVGNADCGEMLRLWVKFKEQNGKRVIDRATFQSFGCETAIAVASVATEVAMAKPQSRFERTGSIRIVAKAVLKGRSIGHCESRFGKAIIMHHRESRFERARIHPRHRAQPQNGL